LKSFAPESLLFIPWGRYVQFHEDILWCHCCNRLRLWGGAGQLVYIPVFSLVQVHHERIAHMCHLSPFGRGEEHLWTFRWGMDNAMFSFQAFSIVSRARMELRWQSHSIQGSTFRVCFNFGNFHTCCVAPVVGGARVGLWWRRLHPYGVGTDNCVSHISKTPSCYQQKKREK